MKERKLFMTVKKRILSVFMVLSLILCAFSACAQEKSSEEQGGYTIDNIRDYVVGINEEMELENGTRKAVIDFDNAATTPALQPVADEVDEQLEKYGSIGRGFSPKSDYSTDLYNSTRDKVLGFVGADPDKYTVFYVSNTTDGLNKLASALIEDESDIILTTRIEHHSNDLPWRESGTVIYAEVDDQGRVMYDDIERQLQNNKVKYVSVTAASNVTGYVTDVHRVAKLAHKYGAKIIVDGAQIVAHRKFSMMGDTPDENIDFFVFSAHKMYAPYGGGAVIGLTEELQSHMPKFYGGGTIHIVGDEWVEYAEAPKSYEAGSPNYPGVVAMGKAIDVLEEIGFDNIEAHEKELNQRLVDGLLKMDNIIIYGDYEDLSDRVGVITFNFSDANSQLVAEELSHSYGIATRRGAFCANPYVWRLYGLTDEQVHNFAECSDVNTPGMIRVSFGIYNTEDEVDYLLKVLPKAVKQAKKTNEKNWNMAEPAY